MTATYNRVELLQEFIESLIKQTYPLWEWLVIDNGSTDKTSELIESYRARFPQKIKSFRLEQNAGGFSQAIRKFIHHAQGELFYFVGDDDILLPEMFELVVREFRKNPELGLVYGNYWKLWIKDGRTVSKILQCPIDYQGIDGRSMTAAEFVRSRATDRRRAVVSCTAVVKKSVYEAVGGWTSQSQYQDLHDMDLWFKVATSYKIKQISQPLSIVRKNYANTSLTEFEALTDLIIQYWSGIYKKTDDQFLKKAIKEYLFHRELQAVGFYLDHNPNYRFFQRHARQLLRHGDFWFSPRFYLIPLASFLPEKLLFWSLYFWRALG